MGSYQKVNEYLKLSEKSLEIIGDKACVLVRLPH